MYTPQRETLTIQKDLINVTKLKEEAHERAITTDDDDVIETILSLAVYGLDCNEKTKKMHKENMYLFVDWLASMYGKGKGVTRFHRDVFVVYKQYLRNMVGASPAVKNKRLSAARFLIQYLYRSHPEVVDRDISLGIRNFKVLRKEKTDGYSQAEIKKIWKVIDEMDDDHIKNNYEILFCLLIYQGFRAGEIIAANFDDVDFDAKTIVLRGTKKGTDEVVPLHHITLQKLRDGKKWGYKWPVRAEKAIGARPCVFSKSGHRITRYETLRTLADMVLMRVGAKRRTLHQFRSYMITDAVKRQNVLVAQKIARHTDTSTTSGYVFGVDKGVAALLSAPKRRTPKRKTAKKKATKKRKKKK